MKDSRILQERKRGHGPPSQLEIEAIIAASPSVLGPGQLSVPPFYTLLYVQHLEGSYSADDLLHSSLETIDQHLVDQLCCGSEDGREIVPARLYNFLSVYRNRVNIDATQVVHLYEHLLLHPLMRYRRIKNKRLQARTHGSVIYFDNVFEPEGDVVCQVVWECLAQALRGQTYPGVSELDQLIGYALLQTTLVASSKTAS